VAIHKKKHIIVLQNTEPMIHITFKATKIERLITQNEGFILFLANSKGDVRAGVYAFAEGCRLQW